MTKRLPFRRKYLAIPYAVFLLVFVVIPLFFIAWYAFTDETGRFTFDNFVTFFTESAALSAFVYSVWYGLLTTLLCLLIGFPIAWIFAAGKTFQSRIWIVLFILPMWVNFLLRTLVTRNIFEFFQMENGAVNSLIGMVYNFLPFMIMPVYTVLLKLDRSLIEAAQDLGATPFQVFYRVVIPSAVPGVMSGILMVFMPTISTFAISDLLSGGTVQLLGNLINDQFLKSSAWNYGAAVAFIMLVMIGVAVTFMNKGEKEVAANGGGQW